MYITFRNKGSEFRFFDKFCSSYETSTINYNTESRALFDVVGISLQQKVYTVKRTVEQKKLFRTLMVEVEEPTTEFYIKLSYKTHSREKTISTTYISVATDEIKQAQDVVKHIAALILRNNRLEQERQAEDAIRHRKLLIAEQKRLSQCIYDLVVIDFETTGIKNPMEDEKYDEIVSVSIIDQDGNVLLNSLCKPQRRKTWAKAQEIHGISPAMVKNQPSFEELFPAIKAILYKAKMVIAYNIAFEMNFLWGFDLEFGKPGGTQLIRNVVWGPDPMLMYCSYQGIERWQKLTTVARHFKFSYAAHDSLEDVRATLHCYKKLIEFVQQNPDQAQIILDGYAYADGIKGKWLDCVSYRIKQDTPVDYPDVYRNK